MSASASVVAGSDREAWPTTTSPSGAIASAKPIARRGSCADHALARTSGACAHAPAQAGTPEVVPPVSSLVVVPPVLSDEADVSTLVDPLLSRTDGAGRSDVHDASPSTVAANRVTVVSV